MNNEIIHLNDSNFDKEISKVNQLILVDFWAEWCGPCRTLSPILHEISNEYQGKIIVAKVNVDQSPNVASKYNIRSIPSLFLFKNGETIAIKVGILSKSQLQEFLNVNLYNINS